MTSVRERAAHLWRRRRRSELEAALRFDMLASELEVQGSPERIVQLARGAAVDERRHAALCDDLVRHFGGVRRDEPPIALRRVAPQHLSARDRTLYEVVAMSCVTETLSTALLGVLVERASDSVARQTMHSVLRDEVRHSRLGWAHLAYQHDAGLHDCVGAHLPKMLEDTVGGDLFAAASGPEPLDAELTGLGRLDVAASRQVVCDTLTTVILPGLRWFGIDVSGGERWLRREAALRAQLPQGDAEV